MDSVIDTIKKDARALIRVALVAVFITVGGFITNRGAEIALDLSNQDWHAALDNHCWLGPRRSCCCVACNQA